MTVYNRDMTQASDDPKLALFHNSRHNPIEVICTKDCSGHGFGRCLRAGDIVIVEGTVHNHLGFCISVPKETAFYPYDHFEPIKDIPG